MTDTKAAKSMNISEAVKDKPVTNGHVFTADAYRPARTLATQPSLWVVQDAALQTAGAYSLIEHGISMGLYGFGSQFMGYAALSGLMQDGLIAACVNTLASDMTRAFIKLFMSGDDNEAEGDTIVADLEEDLVKHKIRKTFNTAASWIQQFGGCMLFIDTGARSGDLLQPLSDHEIKEGFKGFKLIEPINTSPGSYNSSNPLADDFFVPSTWWIWAQEVHKSRLIQFVGEELNTLLKPSYNFYGIPHVQRIYDAVLHFKENRQSVNRMLKKYSSMVFKTNIQDIISNGGSPRELDKRVTLFMRNQSNDGVFVIDYDSEDVVKVESNLAGLKDILQQSLEYVAALDRKPAVKLLGLSPSGFSTGDTDLDNYYDNVQAQQEGWFRGPLQRVLEVLQLVRYGEINDNLLFDFVELSEEDELQAAQIRKTDADTGAVLITNGVVSPEEERERIKMTEGSGYDNLTMTGAEADVENDPESKQLVDLIAGMLRPGQQAGVSDAWNEEDHPRDEIGQFSSSSGENQPKPESSHDAPPLGPAYSEYTGKPDEAINTLLANKDGHVPGAIHKDGIDNDIAFVWGNEKGGLKHAIEKHGEQIVKDLPQNIKEGKILSHPTDPNRKIIFNEKSKTIVALKYNAEAMPWVITTYKISKSQYQNERKRLEGNDSTVFDSLWTV